MCQSGSLSDHENVRGGFGYGEVSGPRVKVSWESEFGGERRI